MPSSKLSDELEAAGFRLSLGRKRPPDSTSPQRRPPKTIILAEAIAAAARRSGALTKRSRGR